MATLKFRPIIPKRPLTLLEGLEQVQARYGRLLDAVQANNATAITLWNDLWDAVHEVRTQNPFRPWLSQILNLVQETLKDARPVLFCGVHDGGQLRALLHAFTALTAKVNAVRRGRLT